jgi:ribosomal protein L7/L12
MRTSAAMKDVIATALILSLSFAACGKENAKSTEPAKIVESGEQAGSIPPSVEPPEKKSDSPAVPAVNMDAVHAHLKAGKKINAIKEYRELHGKLGLNASKMGVEVEQQKLGMPSTLDVHKLYFEGKEDEALQALAAMYKQSAEEEGIQRLWSQIETMGPATEENLKIQAAAGESTAALAIYHQLHPETPISEAWKAVEALMGK